MYFYIVSSLISLDFLNEKINSGNSAQQQISLFFKYVYCKNRYNWLAGSSLEFLKLNTKPYTSILLPVNLFTRVADIERRMCLDTFYVYIYQNTTLPWSLLSASYVTNTVTSKGTKHPLRSIHIGTTPKTKGNLFFHVYHQLVWITGSPSLLVSYVAFAITILQCEICFKTW